MIRSTATGKPAPGATPFSRTLTSYRPAVILGDRERSDPQTR